MRRTIADGTLIVGAVFWSLVVVCSACDIQYQHDMLC
jgi:hypothetical protein